MALTRWEYKTITMEATGFWVGGKIDAPRLNAALNRLGDEGWEVTTAFDTNQAYGSTRDVVVILRREKA